MVFFCVVGWFASVANLAHLAGGVYFAVSCTVSVSGRVRQAICCMPVERYRQGRVYQPVGIAMAGCICLESISMKIYSSHGCIALTTYFYFHIIENYLE